MNEICRDIVSALVWSKDDKLFMGRKHPKKGGVYADCWHIPGGGIDEGEEKEAALVREIMEETGIDISNAKPVLVDDKGSGSTEKTLKTGKTVVCNMTFNVYEVRLGQNADEIEVALEDDLEEHRWVTKEEMKTMKLTPPSVALFERIG